MESTNRDKMVTLRLSPIDIYMANYVFYNNMAMLVRNCPDMIDSLVTKLRDEILNGYDGKINKLFKQYEKIKLDKAFGTNEADIAGTKISVGKPYNVFVNEKVISELQEYIIKHTEIKKPHSSWIIQLSIVNAFIPLAKRLGDYDIDKKDKFKSEDIGEIEKIELIEKFVGLFKNTKMNATKINQIIKILENE